ncbi:MAG TPA: HEAT repeat domain-containing protein [Candidatus Krumholzibacteria bacterium]|nr:HEAT repeat domain-containing protein [Candidatus Krumholzibacteria bacterium]
MKAPSAPETAAGRKATAGDPVTLEKVKGIFAALARYVGAQAIYEQKNPNRINFANAFEQAFRTYFETEKELVLMVSQYQLTWREHVVYDIGPSKDSIAFLLFKDGVGEITFHTSVRKAELDSLVEIISTELYHPSARVDIVTRLWQCDFPSIFYRILDEQTDTRDGDGDGPGSGSRQEPINASDHPELAETPVFGRRRDDTVLESLGEYLSRLASSSTPTSGPGHEEQLQRIFASEFSVEPDTAATWLADAWRDDDDMIALLRVALDFTHATDSPEVVHDVCELIERLVQYIRDEANIPTLIRALQIRRGLDREPLQAPYAAVPNRIEAEITGGPYLQGLVRSATRSRERSQEVLAYLAMVGDSGVLAVCELLKESTDAVVHERVRGMLLDIASLYLDHLIEAFDVENPLLAKDAVFLLCRTGTTEVPAVIRRILASPQPEIRSTAIEFLIQASNDEAFELLRDLLRDGEESVRTRTLQAIEKVPHPLFRDELMSTCFQDATMLRSTDELEHLFRVLGSQAGESALEPLRQMTRKKRWWPGASQDDKRLKLLAITALRRIPGADAQAMLDAFAQDNNNLVKAKAVYVLKQRAQGSGAAYEAVDAKGTDEHER